MLTDQDRLALRPQLPLAPAAAPAEKFQNETLRPVLKQQHPLLESVFRAFLVKRKVNLEQIPADQRFGKIKDLVTRDHHLRNLLTGMIIGQFTAPEMSWYLAQQPEVNRRLTNLLTERLTSIFAPHRK